MKASKFFPKAGFLITRKEVVSNKTAGGLEVEENSDDFLVFGEVVSTGSAAFAAGTFVVYHILESQSFRDGSETMNVVHEDDVFGTYDPRD